MLYESTRGGVGGISAAQALVQGIAPDGGLYVPQYIPKLTGDDIHALCALDYPARAAYILGLFFDFQGVSQATEVYRDFSYKMAPLGDAKIVELWHGPTAAFKDMALQVLPRLLVSARRHLGLTQRTLILTATSGDTGGAALAGFSGVEDTAVLAFYPHGGVSAMQRRQMRTQPGANVYSQAVVGNFDTTQRGVKALFADQSLRGELAQAGWSLSSANSINWGRLAPQIVYYFSVYCDLLAQGTIKPGDALTYVVPTGNFGHILAGWYARQMGLPIGRLICASNANHILTDFFNTGIYDIRRDFHKTISPSMDILISSNLERLLYELCGRDGKYIAGLMEQLAQGGAYHASDVVMQGTRGLFEAGWAGDEATRRAINQTFDAYGYLADPHTAVAIDVWRAKGGGPAVIFSTANPYKFPQDMLCALGHLPGDSLRDDWYLLRTVTGVGMPRSLAALLERIEPTEVAVDAADMVKSVRAAAGII